MEKGEEGWAEIREALDRREQPRVELHWEIDRYQGKEKAWWTGSQMLYRDGKGTGHFLHREIGKIPIPEETEVEEVRMLSPSRAVPMLLVRFFQELFTV